MFNKTVLVAILAFFISLQGCSDETPIPSRTEKVKALLPVEAMTESDCFTCHFVEESSFGPAYLKIAERYGTREVTIRDLGKKVQKGGGGLWGGAQMSRHPFLKDREVDEMVSWVLSLHEREVQLMKSYEDHPPVEVKDSGDGLKIDIYLDEEGLYPKDSTLLFSNETLLTGHIDQFWMDADVVLADNMFPAVAITEGHLNIELDGKYLLRLKGKKTGCLYIDGTQVISLLASDKEALVELTPGKHTIRIETLLKQRGDFTALEWIAPGDEYYRAIPPDRFSF